ncbi:type IV pilus biosynthesis protein [Caballeronia calidae]|uniref:Type IV pilus biosynthesis protein n=1 Tax=Caballeronia calidae TaxID=1777139 RepID=A0A158EED5_9BURK|nr:type II secretion system F family protein [Caballeronia calidae]SAL05235.1 type IV pilus biosynthesis protein [Caballeronia calidae]
MMASRLSWRLRRKFYEQAESQIANGVELTVVLEDFRKRLMARGRVNAAKTIEEVTRLVRDGQTLTSAFGDVLTPLERRLLASGERGSKEKSERNKRMPEAIRLILSVRDLVGSMQRMLFSSLLSPVVLFLLTYATLAVIGLFVVPSLLPVVPLSQWKGSAYVMYLMGQLAVGWEAPLLFGSIAAYAIWSLWALPRWTGVRRAFFDNHIFPFPIYREIHGFAWTLSFVAQLRAGIPETAALENDIASATPWLASRLKPVYENVKYGGLDLAAAMRRTGSHFPSPDLIEEVGVYIGFPDFAEKLEVMLDRHAKSVERKFERKAVVIGVFALIVPLAAGLFVGIGSNGVAATMSSAMGH